MANYYPIKLDGISWHILEKISCYRDDLMLWIPINGKYSDPCGKLECSKKYGFATAVDLHNPINTMLIDIKEYSGNETRFLPSYNSSGYAVTIKKFNRNVITKEPLAKNIKANEFLA